MSFDFEDPLMLDLRPLAARWWALVIRALAATALGVLFLHAPEAGLLALVIVWSVYAVFDERSKGFYTSRAERCSPLTPWAVEASIGRSPLCCMPPTGLGDS